MKDLIIDCFAGGGGASVGIEMALGRSVDIAINHDPDAILMHKTNHPGTLHLTENIFKVDLQKYVGNQDVIMAMVNSGDYTLQEALVVYSTACERCMNVLAYKYLNGADGYEEYSDDWKKCNTECDFCKIKEDTKC